MVELVAIDRTNAFAYRAIRLRALQDVPTGFGSTYARESLLSDEDWLNRAAACAAEGSVGYLAMESAAACGIVRATPDECDSSIAWVESMWVAPTHRRRGIGRMLVGRILDWGLERKLQALKLCVTGNNQAAIAFYERLGFSMTGKVDPYPNDVNLVEYEMMRLLH